MDTEKTETADDILTCSKCGGRTMFVYVEENGVQTEKCASCGNLVAYTEKLIRVLEKA
jgi:hypothetical protein